MILFKTASEKLDFYNDSVRKDLKVIVLMLATYMLGRYDLTITITTVLGLGEGHIKRKSTTHEDGRAIDIRTKDWNWLVTEHVVEWLNRTFATGAYFQPDRPMMVAVYHDVGYGKHIHIQVAHRPVKINMAIEAPILI